MTQPSSERPLVFECEGDELIGVVTLAPTRARRGIVIIVGGPQYRVGSHRQFTLLCRRLAMAGYPSLRFDYRGMGDSSGAPRGFDAIDADVRAAIAAFGSELPEVQEFVLLGLCDGASAAMMFGPSCERVKGLVVLNPWARSTATFARTQIKHYYVKRMLQPAFWSKLSSGRINIAEAAASFEKNLRQARADTDASSHPFVVQMRKGLARFSGHTLLVLSGNDLVAREFADVAASDREWRSLLASPRVRRIDVPEADHTFSRESWRAAVEKSTIEWLGSW